MAGFHCRNWVTEMDDSVDSTEQSSPDSATTHFSHVDGWPSCVEAGGEGAAVPDEFEVVLVGVGDGSVEVFSASGSGSVEVQ